MVVASPHSGRRYPDDLKKATRLDPVALRRSEDCYVDSLFADAPFEGAPLLAAMLPRAYVDLNREPFEIDPELVADPIPDWCNTTSLRVSVGLGTVPRVVGDGQPIYRDRLPIQEVFRRIDSYYRPYHRELARLIDETRVRFGYALLIDAHSMPSLAVSPPRPGWASRAEAFGIDRGQSGTWASRPTGGRSGADIVLGDCFGTACSQGITQKVDEFLSAQGLKVVRNTPYAGGYTTRHYGRPTEGVHALQIEINRALYMDERTLEPNDGLGALRPVLTKLIGHLGENHLALDAAE